MKRKGFTLIELIAVIVILAITLLIAIPIITGIVDKSKKGTAEVSALNYIDAVEKYVMLHDLDSVKYPYDLRNNTFNVSSNTEVSLLDIIIPKAKAENTIPALNSFITVKGDKPKNGTITTNEKGKVTEADLLFGKFNVECTENKCIATKDRVTLTINEREHDVLEDGQSITLTVTTNSDKEITWSSSDDNVATVENGVVTGVDTGEATITAKTGKTSDSITISVKKVMPESFSTDAWKTIIAAVKSNNTSKYHVGDTKTINMGSFGNHVVRIANMSTPSSCSNASFSQTACGFVIEFTDIITTHNMNPATSGNSYGTNIGGWPATSMRTYINNDIYNSLPSELKDGIINTKVVSSHGKNDSANFTSTDKLYLLTIKELYNYNYDKESDYTSTRQLDYYSLVGLTHPCNGINTKALKNQNGSNNYWWLRSSLSNNSQKFVVVSTNGGFDYYASKNVYGVSPAFRIG